MPRQENKKQYLFNSVVYSVYKNLNGNFIILHRYKFAICANFDIFIFHYKIRHPKIVFFRVPFVILPIIIFEFWLLSKNMLFIIHIYQYCYNIIDVLVN